MRTRSRMLWADNGMVLISTVVLLGALMMTSGTVYWMATTEMRIGRNYKQGGAAYYKCLAGYEEARARLRKGASHAIPDAYPGETGWRVYLGASNHVRDMGFDPENSLHERLASLGSGNSGAVEIRHQLDASGAILLWGDTDGNGTPEKNTNHGENIYLITSSYVSTGPRRTIQVAVARNPALPVPGALYAKGAVAVQGNSTFINGKDRCGSGDIAGIVTMGGGGDVVLAGAPEIAGVGSKDPNVSYNGKDLNLRKVADGFRKTADFAYGVTASDQGPGDIPGPGDGWGTPLSTGITDPLSCTDTRTVYYDTNGTYVRFVSGVAGCGVLLVDGDLEIADDFAWYGPIVVTGSVLFTGTGDKQITGALFVGGDVVVGGSSGNTSLLYCSQAISSQSQKKPLRVLSWKE